MTRNRTSTREPLGLLEQLTSTAAPTVPAPAHVKPGPNGKRPTPIIIYPTVFRSGMTMPRSTDKSGRRSTKLRRSGSFLRVQILHQRRVGDPGGHMLESSDANSSRSRSPDRPSSNNVTPESIVVPIVSCIFGFPLLALTVICCLRHRAKLARERARRRNCELDRGELSVVRLSPVVKRQRAVSLARSPRALPTLELDTVLEERSDPEQTTVSQVEVTPDREVGAILFGAAGAMGTAAAVGCVRDRDS